MKLLVILFLLFCLVITIPRISKGVNGGEIYDRIHYCYYFRKLDIKIGRHIQENIKSEFKSLVSLEKENKDVQLDLLRFRGDLI